VAPVAGFASWPAPAGYGRGVVNLYSDTQTRPTPGMRQAMASAEVGDEQSFADPTVNALCERVADLLGHEAAVFLPSGTMCNAIAFRLHIGPGGDEVVLHRTSHPLIAEAGGPAAISGAVLCPVDGERGMFDAETLQGVLRRPGDRYVPRSRLVSLEQTTNIAGGRVWPLEQMESVLAVARGAGMRAHLDGARLMNAVVASGVPARDWAGGFDTAWLDFTKGLGAPVGAVLAGSRELIEEAWRYKQMWGGAMRQAGIVAAAGLYALDRHVDRLADDHSNARALAEGLAELDGVDLDPRAVETNIVVFGVPDAAAFCAALERAGVRMSAIGPQRVRAVTHLDVGRADVEQAIEATRSVLGVVRSVTTQ
jgi:threonine aldolase